MRWERDYLNHPYGFRCSPLRSGSNPMVLIPQTFSRFDSIMRWERDYLNHPYGFRCSPLRSGSNPMVLIPQTFSRFDSIMRWERDSNPRYSYPYVSLANWWFQPLTHPTFVQRTRATKLRKAWNWQSIYVKKDEIIELSSNS